MTAPAAKDDRARVPCSGCTACCDNDLLILHPECGDDPTQYETQVCINPVTGLPAEALAHKPEGGCVYLTEAGCSIHDRAPAICREFDCRRFYQSLVDQMTRPERRQLVKSGKVGADVLKAGRDRLHTLEFEPA